MENDAKVAFAFCWKLQEMGWTARGPRGSAPSRNASHGWLARPVRHDERRRPWKRDKNSAILASVSLSCLLKEYCIKNC